MLGHADHSGCLIVLLNEMTRFIKKCHSIFFAITSSDQVVFLILYSVGIAGSILDRRKYHDHFRLLQYDSFFSFTC
jgi:hypothetical protein